MVLSEMQCEPSVRKKNERHKMASFSYRPFEKVAMTISVDTLFLHELLFYIMD